MDKDGQANSSDGKLTSIVRMAPISFPSMPLDGGKSPSLSLQSTLQLLRGFEDAAVLLGNVVVGDIMRSLEGVAVSLGGGLVRLLGVVSLDGDRDGTVFAKGVTDDSAMLGETRIPDPPGVVVDMKSAGVAVALGHVALSPEVGGALGSMVAGVPEELDEAAGTG